MKQEKKDNKKQDILIKNEERFRNLFENANDAIWLMDKNTFIDCNRRAVELFKCKNKKDVINHTPMDFSPPRQPDGKFSKDKAFKYISAALKGHPQRFYWKHKNKKGELIDAEISLNIIISSGKRYIQAIGRDITERKIAEKKLRESEEIFKNIFKYSAAGVSLIDINGRWIEVNDIFCKITGYSKKELLSYKYVDITHKNDKAKSKYFFKKILLGKIKYRYFEKRYVHKNGSIIWVYLSLSLIRDSFNKPLYFITHIQDITKNKIIEESLKESEEKYRTLMDNSPDAIVVYIENKIVYVNNECVCLMKASSKKQLIGKKVMQFVHPDSRKIVIERMKKVTKEGIILPSIEEKFICLDGSSVDVEVKSMSIKLGSKLAVQLIARDITERKESEKKIEESEEKYRRLFESSKDSILILNENSGAVVDLNPFVQNLFLYNKEELLGKKIYEIETFKKVISGINEFRKIRKKGYIRYDNLALKTKDGRVKYVEFILTTYFVNGKKLIQCNLRDLTERMELEEAKSGFLSITSHQLRTPLSITKWVLDAMLHDGDLSPKQLKRCKDLIISNERLIYLVNDLLNVSLIETGKLVVNKRNTNLDKLINELVSSFKILAEKRKKYIKINIPPNIKNVYCDPVLVHEIIENLLSNALNYAYEKSLEVNITIEERKDDYLVSVHNDGYIEPVAADKIKNFGKFVRGSSSSEIEPAGSGLGLYITKKMTEASGGTIWFESSIQDGTTFYVTIIKNNKK